MKRSPIGSSNYARAIKAVAGIALAATTAQAQTVTDNFADGDDTANPAWTHSNTALSNPTFDATGGNYRLQSAVGPFGLSYAGSFVSPTYSDFLVQMDLVNFSTNADIAVGVVGRAAQVTGAAAIDGYLFGYEMASQEFTIGSVLNASITDITGLGPRAIALDPTKDYRLIFTGFGTTLTGMAYELDGSGNTVGAPIVNYTVTDVTYSSGLSGLLGYGSVPLDFTVDNFAATIPEPGTVALGLLGGLALLARRRNR